jgi:hypothetical protein
MGCREHKLRQFQKLVNTRCNKGLFEQNTRGIEGAFDMFPCCVPLVARGILDVDVTVLGYVILSGVNNKVKVGNHTMIL